LKESQELFNDDCGMLVSVKSPEDSPYYNQFRENEKGYLEDIISRSGFSRQSVPPIYTYNGGIYIFRAEDVLCKHLHELSPVKKYLMSDMDSHQIDTPLDWLVAEAIVKEKFELSSEKNTNENAIK
jgi:N-acylneuraminate cytidylyltransferase